MSAQLDLLTLCRCLSGNPTVRGAGILTLQAEPLRRAVFELAGRERLLPALHEAVAQHPEHVPKIERVPLAIAHAANRKRNRQIRDAAFELAAEAARHSIDVVALKGATWAIDDPEGCAAWRPMVDLDVLVLPEHYEAVRDVLAKLGYRPTRREHDFLGRRRFDGHYHLVAHAREGAPFFVEVHRHVGWQPALLPNELIFQGRRQVAQGLGVPSRWHAALLTVVHWQIHHYGMQRGLLRLMDAMEIARLLQRDDVDWHAVAQRATETGMGRELDAAVAVAAELFAAPVPAPLEISPAARAYVTKVLRIRSSRIYAWRAKQQERFLRLWDDRRFRYRMALGKAAPSSTSLGLWMLRARRLPFLAAHLLSIGLLQIVLWIQPPRSGTSDP